MANERAGAGFAIFTILGLIVLVATVALLINSYDSGTDAEALRPAVSSEVVVGSAAGAAGAAGGTEAGAAPVGGVATGGGGTATEGGANVALAVLGGLGALTLLTAAGMSLRHRLA